LPKITFNRLADDKKERVMRTAIEEFQVRCFENAKIELIGENSDERSLESGCGVRSIAILSEVK